MLRKIKLYGRLRKFCNNERFFEAAVNRPIDAIAFLKCNFKGIEEHMADQHYCIKVRGMELEADRLTMNMEGDIQIIPLAHGNIFGLIIGFGLKTLGGSIGAKLLGSKILATVATTVLTTVGTSMIIDGVSNLLTPSQTNNRGGSNMDSTDPAAFASNYTFTGLSNISRQGVPVNVVFGEIFVGSITISNGVDTVQIKGEA